MLSDEKDGDTHHGVFSPPLSDFIDFESQNERYSLCFIISCYNNCLCMFSAFISHLFCRWMVRIITYIFFIFTDCENGFPNERRDAEAFYICCHNGWHLLIMSIISLFNAFNRVQIWNRWWICRRTLNTTRAILLRTAVSGRPSLPHTLPYRGRRSIIELRRKAN